jgi:hypothetical protein
MKLSLNRRNAALALITCACAGLLGMAGAAATTAAYVTAAPAAHQVVQSNAYQGGPAVAPNQWEE